MSVLFLLTTPIKNDLNLTDTEVSWLQGPAFAITFSFSVFFIGRLADRRSRPAIIACGVAIWSVMCTASGVANSNEANVPWQIRQGDKVVKSGFSTAQGWMDKLYPWESDPIDVSDLAPGEYTFVAMTDDPSGGEGFGPQVDTRTINIR